MLPSALSVHTDVYTMSVRARYLEALEKAVQTLGDVAEGCGRHYRTLQSYQRGERRVTEGAARDLVEYLRDRAADLQEAADRLEAAATEKEGSDGE